MTEREQFEVMLTSHGVPVWHNRPDTDDPPGTVIVEIGHAGIVNTFNHCFCEFRFDASGNLSEIRFGY
jgi:hypothetical protein